MRWHRGVMVGLLVMGCAWIDLKVQQLQTATIELPAAQKELENGMKQTDMGDIIGWVQGQEQFRPPCYVGSEKR